MLKFRKATADPSAALGMTAQDVFEAGQSPRIGKFRVARYLAHDKEE